MKRTIAFIANMILVLPLIAAAQPEAPTMEAEIDAWLNMTSGNMHEENLMKNDIEFQSAKELFPEFAEEIVQPQKPTETVRDDRTAPFVSVVIDGKLTVLGDVPRESWFAPYVRDIAEAGIVSGYRDAAGKPTGLFGPADNVTLEQMAKIVVLASGRSIDNCAGSLLNQTASDWSRQFISCAEKLEWSVYAEGSVDVKRNATRAEVVATVLQGFGVETGVRTGTGFTDVTLATEYGAAIEKAQSLGIVSGYTDAQGRATGLFGPQDSVTRAEIAKIITIAIQLYAQD